MRALLMTGRKIDAIAAQIRERMRTIAAAFANGEAHA